MTIRRRRPDMVMHMVGVNGSYGLLTEERGRVTGVMGFSVRGGRIAEIDMVMNPEKVRHVGVPSIGTEGPTASRKG